MAREDNLRPWQPGQSGNPAGRPKMPEELKESLRRINAAAIKRLEAHLEDEATPLEVVRKIANDSADRLYGKPAQVVEATVQAERPIVFDSSLNEKLEGNDGALDE